MNRVTRWMLTCVLLLGASFVPDAQAQGVTTAAVNGVVTDTQGESLPGVNIVAVHEPSGTQYGVATRSDGRYNLRNLRVGGPYTITVSYVGFRTAIERGVMLELSENREINFRLQDEALELEGVSVEAEANALLSSENVGTGTNVSEEQIERLPTISRSLVDFTRLTPQFSQVGTGGRAGSSVGGQSSRFNNIQVDGAAINDAFGLESSGTPGGSSGTQPISLDAVQEFRVAISPYDVSQGNFSGGSINVITRSGTNRFEGSGYYLGRNESFVGKLEGEGLNDFSEFTAGARLGGPIIKNKLFFFVNGETVRRTDPSIAGFLDAQAGAVNFDANRASVERVLQIAQGYGRDAGTLGAFDTETVSNKLFARLDLNINQANKATLRFNYVKGDLDDGISRSTTFYTLQDRYYKRENTNTSTVFQLNSLLGAKYANEFRLSLQTNRQPSTLQFPPFPSIEIRNVGNGDARPDGTTSRGGTVVLGPDQFRGANNIDADIWELTNNFNIFAGNHVITLGTQNTYQTFANLFIRNFYGYYRFNSVADFEAGRASRFERNYSAIPGESRPLAEFGNFIFGVYAQDDWRVNDRLKVNVGLRLDLPFYPDNPALAADGRLASGGAGAARQSFESIFGFDNSEVPNGNPIISPRAGFNLDVFGDRSTQLRGGVGVFAGRFPGVWISNSFSNDGSLLGGVSVSPSSSRPVTVNGQTLSYVPFREDPDNQYTAASFGLSEGSAEINLTDPDFKSPTNLRTNLAVDQALPGGLVATAEVIYSDVINGMKWEERNITPYTTNPATVDGRGQSRSVISPDYQSVILLTNTSKGYAANVTGQIQKPIGQGFLPDAFFSLAYNFGRVKDINSVTSSQARSNVRDLTVAFDVNDPPLTTSNFEVRHRVLATASYRLAYANRFATTATLLYDGHSGLPYSFVYGRGADPNDDGFDRADLAYIPADRSEVSMSDEDWTAFNSYIEGNEFLRKSRGKVFERNSARAPWQNVLDLSLTQEVNTLRGQRLELKLDVLNVLNLVNSDWGLIETIDDFDRFELVDFEGYEADGRVKLSDPATREPASVDDLASRWQLQLGVRYTF